MSGKFGEITLTEHHRLCIVPMDFDSNAWPSGCESTNVKNSEVR